MSHPRASPLTPPSSRPAARRLLVPVPLAPPLPAAPTPDRILPAPPPVPASVQLAARALTGAVVEVLRGRRPAAHLDDLMDPAVVEACEGLAGAVPSLRLRSLRVQLPAPGVVEAAAHLDDGRASRAAALRLQCSGGRWRCVRLEIALTSGAVTRAGSSSASDGWPADAPCPGPAAPDGPRARPGTPRSRPPGHPRAPRRP